jgi:hypothetical protein
MAIRIITQNCPDASITNSGVTYSASTPAGSTFQLPNDVIEFIDLSGNTITSWIHPPLSNQTVSVSGVCIGDLVIVSNINSGDTSTTYTALAEAYGVVTTLAVSGGLTGISYSVNSSPVTLPFNLTIGDVLVVSFDAANNDTSMVLIGNS